MSLIKLILLTILALVLMLATWGTMLQGAFALIFLISLIITGAKTYFNATTQ